MTANHIQYKFGDFLLDTQSGFLFKDQEIVPLNQRSFKVLELLVKNTGCLVTKKDFMETVWKDCYVVEGNLTVAINGLRKILHQEDKFFIETFSGRGYRFIGEVEQVTVIYPPIRKQLNLTFVEGSNYISETSQNFEITNLNNFSQTNTFNKFFNYFTNFTKFKRKH